MMTKISDLKEKTIHLCQQRAYDEAYAILDAAEVEDEAAIFSLKAYLEKNRGNTDQALFYYTKTLEIQREEPCYWVYRSWLKFYCMERFTGILGIIVILGIAFLLSNNKKSINYRLVLSGIGLQLVIALLVLKVPFITNFFAMLGRGMGKIEQFATQGASFVYGGIMIDTHDGASKSFSAPPTFVFAFSVTATIIIVCVLVAVLYHIGFMQKVISVIAKVMNFVMRVSGAEALSNVASAFVGQVEAQVMIRPYLPTMTKSELMASMAGSMACIAGGILIVYVNMGAKAEYLLT